MRMYDEVGVDWSRGSLYGDCWEELFERRDTVTVPYVTVSEYPFYDLTAACAGILYQNTGWGWRDRFHECWKKLGVRAELSGEADEFLAGRPDVVSVLIRSNAIAGEQLFGRMQTLDEYASAMERVRGPLTEFFVMSSDKQSLEWVAKRFPCFFDPTVRRGLRRDLPEPHLEVPQTAEDAKRCLVEVLVASRCRALIHPISNMATAALYINPQLQSVYLK